MRAMMIAAAALAVATPAAADEAAACYDAVVVGWVTDYANSQELDSAPTPADRILPRVRTDALVRTSWQVAGAPLPKAFWARAVVTEAPDPSPMRVIYLKTQSDGVPAIVGYRWALPLRSPMSLDDYPAC